VARLRVSWPRGTNLAATDFNLYVLPSRDYNPSPQYELPVRACQLSWRYDSQALAVMQPAGPCTSTSLGAVITVHLADAARPTTIATNATHPAWQPPAIIT
jgi:hypothetical protein